MEEILGGAHTRNLIETTHTPGTYELIMAAVTVTFLIGAYWGVRNVIV